MANNKPTPIIHIYKEVDKGKFKSTKYFELVNNIKPLETNFKGRGEVKGYDFSQLRMTNRAFLYEVSFGGSKHYEVFKKRVNSRFSCISYPSSKAFGIWAWTYSDFISAIKKYNELNFNY